ncbi:hypothetical protein UXP46_23545 [Enterobacter ludwigii]|uniref:hypothetical protein n=1 Tax=Enterobacter ludwigii TaxID=299767 RepID=UPI002FD2789E
MADGFSEWLPVISTLSGGGLAFYAALVVNKRSHKYALERETLAAKERQRQEQQLAEDKRQKELLYITTELVFTLEIFAEECASVADDSGEPDERGEYRSTTKTPELEISDIKGDWRTLPALIMYRIRELPVLMNEARRNISAAAENDWAPYYTESFQERRYQYARLGLKALTLARRLRQLAGLPGTRLDATEWSAQPVLWGRWRLERNRRYKQRILRERELATFQIANIQHNQNHGQHDKPAGPDHGDTP